MGLDTWVWTDELVFKFFQDEYMQRNSSQALGVMDSMRKWKSKQKQSVDKKDWEIVKMIDNLNWVHEPNANHLNCDENCKIYSVKRLTDNEVFSIGDKVGYGKAATIIRLFISSNGLMWCDLKFESGNEQHNVNIASLDIYKPPLFTTQDGKQIYEGDEFWYAGINESSSPLPYKYNATKNGHYGNSYASHTFSTEEAAKEYILNNKPCLSLSDVEKVCYLMYGREDYEQLLNLNELRQLVKEKLK